MKRTWTKEQENELVSRRKAGASVKDLSVLLDKTESSVRSKLCEIGVIIIDVGTWAAEDIQILYNYYPNSNCEEMEKMIPHKTRSQILYKAKGLGIKKKKSAIRESLRLSHLAHFANVSDIINLSTPDGAALFGFILADGTIYPDKNVVKITLAPKDRNYLEKIRLVLDYDKSIKAFPSEKGGAVTLNVNSTDLIEFIVNNVDYTHKSLDLKYPSVIKGHKYEADFIRGFFDGDGCISKSKRKSKWGHEYRFSLISTKEMCLDIQDSLNRLCDAELKNRKLRKETRIKADNIYYLEYCESSLIHIGNTMYKSVIDEKSNLYLDRKFNRFQELWSKRGLR